MGDANQQTRFEALLTAETYRAAWRYALRLSATREDAEDLLQETLVQAHSKLGSLHDTAKFKGWLLSILRRRFLSKLRHDHARPRAGELPLQLQGAQLDPLAADLAAALASLPEPQRELLSLYYIDGLSLKEVGQVLKLKPGAVGQRLFRARQALRNLISMPDGIAVHSTAQWHPAGGGCHE